MNEEFSFLKKYDSIETDVGKIENGLLIFGECISTMQNMPENSVDFILTDLPYGVSQNKWDEIIPLKEMWECFNKVIKSNGAIALTAIQPFSSMLVMSSPKDFKYEVIWEKTVGSGQLNIKHQPLRAHESILIFYKNLPTYNEQKTIGDPYKITRSASYANEGYGKQKANSKDNNGYRHARSVIKFANPRIKGGHPTQKPVELMEHFIKTFSNEGDIILDCCCGSGTTLIAGLNLKRKVIGIENNEEYFLMAQNRIEEKLNELH